MLQLSRYIHLNPIADGLVRRVEDWEFSNYPEFIGLRNGKLSRPSKVLSYFPSFDDYRIFVEAYVEDDKEIIEHLTFD